MKISFWIPNFAFRIAKLVGFKPTPPISARSKWIAQINNVLTTDVSIDTPYRIDISSTIRPTSIELFAADMACLESLLTPSQKILFINFFYQLLIWLQFGKMYLCNCTNVPVVRFKIP